MNVQTLEAARDEALKFVEAAEALLREQKDPGSKWFIGTRKSGAVRRQSMELTNALSDLRRPG